MVRLQFALDIVRCKELERVESILLARVVAEGGDRKTGPPPKGALEREASRLLEKL